MPIVRPLLDEKIDFLKGEFPELRLTDNSRVVSKLRGLSGGLSVRNYSQCRSGKFRYGKRTVEAIHRAFELHHLDLSADIWGHWNADETVFVATSDEAFQAIVKKAVAKRNAMITKVREQSSDLKIGFRPHPPQEEPVRRDGTLGWAIRGRKGPSFVDVVLGQEYKLFCQAPSKGSLAFVSSIVDGETLEGHPIHRYIRLNEILDLDPRIKRSVFESAPFPMEEPGGAHKLLAFFWPEPLPLPDNPLSRDLFGHKQNARDYVEPNELGAMIQMIIDGQGSTLSVGTDASSALPRPEVQLLEYFISRPS